VKERVGGGKEGGRGPGSGLSSPSHGFSSVNSVGKGGVLEVPAVELEGSLKGGMALESSEEVNPIMGLSPVAAGVDGLLAFTGGHPVGIEGGALFFPFLGGVVDIVGEVL